MTTTWCPNHCDTPMVPNPDGGQKCPTCECVLDGRTLTTPVVDRAERWSPR